MKELKIVEEEKEGYFAYHIAADAGRFLDHTTQTDVPLELLFDGGLREEDVYKAYKIDRFRFSDNYLLYYWIAKAFLTHSENYVICFDSLAEVEKELGAGAQPCGWKYQFQYIHSGQFVEFADWGFIQPGAFLTAAAYSHKAVGDRGYYVKKIAPAQILQSFNLLKSDVSSWNFISLPAWEESRFLDRMRGSKRPELADILGEQNILMALQLGLDEGYCDYMLIKSPARLQAKAREIEKDINERGRRYESRLKEVYYWDFYPPLVNELFDLPLIEV